MSFAGPRQVIANTRISRWITMAYVVSCRIVRIPAAGCCTRFCSRMPGRPHGAERAGAAAPGQPTAEFDNWEDSFVPDSRGSGRAEGPAVLPALGNAQGNDWSRLLYWPNGATVLPGERGELTERALRR